MGQLANNPAGQFTIQSAVYNQAATYTYIHILVSSFGQILFHCTDSILGSPQLLRITEFSVDQLLDKRDGSLHKLYPMISVGTHRVILVLGGGGEGRKEEGRRRREGGGGREEGVRRGGRREGRRKEGKE